MKTGRNGSKNSIGKYHINKNVCIKLSLIDNFVSLQTEILLDLWSIQAFFKETKGENWGFCIEKKRERKMRMIKVAKFCHQVTSTQKTRQKRES